MEVTWTQHSWDTLPGPFLFREDSVLFDICNQSDRNWYAGQFPATYRHITDEWNARCNLSYTPAQVIKKIRSEYVAFKRCFPPPQEAFGYWMLESPSYRPWQIDHSEAGKPGKPWKTFEYRALETVYNILGRQHQLVADAMNQIAATRTWPIYETGRITYTAAMCIGQLETGHINFQSPSRPTPTEYYF